MGGKLYEGRFYEAKMVQRIEGQIDRWHYFTIAARSVPEAMGKLTECLPSKGWECCEVTEKPLTRGIIL